MNTGIRLGVDLGGTKIESAVIGSDGRFLDRRRVPNPRTYEAMLDAILDTLVITPWVTKPLPAP